MARRLQRVLVANRGEIAVRVMRACREMEIETVAVFSEADRGSLHVRYGDRARCIGPPPAAESYLVIDRILEAARDTGADAVHPGYGFLAENPDLATACRDEGLVFVGPTPEAMEAMGSKTRSRQIAGAAGAPVVPGSEEPLSQDEEARQLAEDLGYPIMVKAAAGGGGKGMRIVADAGDLSAALRAARSEARSSFGDDRIYLEKAILRPRHIEIQILGDEKGNLVHLGERECSIQRRHQKVIEEAPSPVLDEEQRERLGRMAVSVAAEAGYTNAGTVEFLYSEDGEFYFLEMNARLQVEHPVTELVTGRDLVKDQLRIAAGEPLGLEQDQVRQWGHAIEGRIYAEDPGRGFLPSPGHLEVFRLPGGPGVRVEAGAEEGGEVAVHYDPLLAKLVVHGADRAEAVDRMRRALQEFQVLGVRTTIPFLQRVVGDEGFRLGDIDTGYVDEMLRRPPPEPDAAELLAAVTAAMLEDRSRRSRSIPPGSRRGSSWRRAARRGALRRS